MASISLSLAVISLAFFIQDLNNKIKDCSSSCDAKTGRYKPAEAPSSAMVFGCP